MDQIVGEGAATTPAEQKTEPHTFMNLSEGAVEPYLNKRIRALILKEEHFIVFLDDHLFVQWATDCYYGHFAADFGKVTNRQGLLEEVSREFLTDQQKAAFQRLLAESIARLLDDKTPDNAVEILDKAEEYLKARTKSEPGCGTYRQWESP